MKERYFFFVVEVQLQGKLHQKVFFGAKCLKMKARPKENCSNFWILASLALHPKASSCLKHFKLKARWQQKKIISDLKRFEQQGGKWVEICCIFRCHLPASQHEKDLRRNEVIWYFSRSVQNSKFLLVVQIYQNTLSVKYISSLLPSNSHLILFDNNFCLSNAQCLNI